MGRPGPWALRGVCTCGETVPVSRIVVATKDKPHFLFVYSRHVCPACGLLCESNCTLRAVREVPVSRWWNPKTWGKFKIETRGVVAESNEKEGS